MMLTTLPDISFLELPLPPSKPAAAQPAPVQPVPVPSRAVFAPRIAEAPEAIMRFEAFKRDYPHRTHTPEQRLLYRNYSVQASQARRRLERRPELAAWYAAREELLRSGQDPAQAGPLPTTSAGREWARQKRQADAKWHQYMMTRELPDVRAVRPHERSAEALEARRLARIEVDAILDYRRKHAPATSPATPPRRSAQAQRMAMDWLGRLQEDERALREMGRTVRCERPTQHLPLSQRQPHWASA